MHKVCPEYADALVDISDGELSADEQREINVHLAECPGCRAELARLNASLSRLVSGIAIEPVTVARRSGSLSRLSWAAAVAAAGLICIGAVWWSAARPGDHSRLAKVVESPSVEISSTPKLSSHDALWRIAVIEQQARLQTSLEMLPKGEAFEEQRREDERLLAKFQSMARDVQSGHVQ